MTVGRPRTHNDNAEKQRAYRQRQKALRNQRYEIGQQVAYALGTHAEPKNGLGTFEGMYSDGAHVRSQGGGLHIIQDMNRIGTICHYCYKD